MKNIFLYNKALQSTLISIYLYFYMLATSGQTAEPNSLNFFEGILE